MYNFLGIIVNSPRCARAIIESFKTLSDDELPTKWKSMKCFVVGNATGCLLSDNLSLTCEGSDCGNLSSLLAVIAKGKLTRCDSNSVSSPQERNNIHFTEK